MVAVAESCPSLFADMPAVMFFQIIPGEKEERFSLLLDKDILVRRGTCRGKKKFGACNCNCNC